MGEYRRILLGFRQCYLDPPKSNGLLAHGPLPSGSQHGVDDLCAGRQRESDLARTISDDVKDDSSDFGFDLPDGRSSSHALKRVMCGLKDGDFVWPPTIIS